MVGGKGKQIWRDMPDFSKDISDTSEDDSFDLYRNMQRIPKIPMPNFKPNSRQTFKRKSPSAVRIRRSTILNALGKRKKLVACSTPMHNHTSAGLDTTENSVLKLSPIIGTNTKDNQETVINDKHANVNNTNSNKDANKSISFKNISKKNGRKHVNASVYATTQALLKLSKSHSKDNLEKNKSVKHQNHKENQNNHSNAKNCSPRTTNESEKQIVKKHLSNSLRESLSKQFLNNNDSDLAGIAILKISSDMEVSNRAKPSELCRLSHMHTRRTILREIDTQTTDSLDERWRNKFGKCTPSIEENVNKQVAKRTTIELEKQKSLKKTKTVSIPASEIKQINDENSGTKIAEIQCSISERSRKGTESQDQGNGSVENDHCTSEMHNPSLNNCNYDAVAEEFLETFDYSNASRETKRYNKTAATESQTINSRTSVNTSKAKSTKGRKIGNKRKSTVKPLPVKVKRTSNNLKRLSGFFDIPRISEVQNKTEENHTDEISGKRQRRPRQQFIQAVYLDQNGIVSKAKQKQLSAKGISLDLFVKPDKPAPQRQKRTKRYSKASQVEPNANIVEDNSAATTNTNIVEPSKSVNTIPLRGRPKTKAATNQSQLVKNQTSTAALEEGSGGLAYTNTDQPFKRPRGRPKKSKRQPRLAIDKPCPISIAAPNLSSVLEQDNGESATTNTVEPLKTVNTRRSNEESMLSVANKSKHQSTLTTDDALPISIAAHSLNTALEQNDGDSGYTNTREPLKTVNTSRSKVKSVSSVANKSQHQSTLTIEETSPISIAAHSLNAALEQDGSESLYSNTNQTSKLISAKRPRGRAKTPVAKKSKHQSTLAIEKPSPISIAGPSLSSVLERDSGESATTNTVEPLKTVNTRRANEESMSSVANKSKHQSTLTTDEAPPISIAAHSLNAALQQDGGESLYSNTNQISKPVSAKRPGRRPKTSVANKSKHQSTLTINEISPIAITSLRHDISECSNINNNGVSTSKLVNQKRPKSNLNMSVTRKSKHQSIVVTVNDETPLLETGIHSFGTALDDDNGELTNVNNDNPSTSKTVNEQQSEVNPRMSVTGGETPQIDTASRTRSKALAQGSCKSTNTNTAKPCASTSSTNPEQSMNQSQLEELFITSAEVPNTNVLHAVVGTEIRRLNWINGTYKLEASKFPKKGMTVQYIMQKLQSPFATHSFGYLILAPNDQTPLQFSKDGFFAYTVEKGEAIVNVDQIQGTVGAGGMFCIPLGVRYTIRNPTKEHLIVHFSVTSNRLNV